MNQRQARLLRVIIDQFIESAIPVGSRKLLESAEFSVSSATIRSEMSELEELGFLEQPHVSSGRVPTVKGYRTYVKDFMTPSSHERELRTRFLDLKDQYFQHKDRERAYEAVALLANMVPNVAFATVPHRERVYYLGLANTVRQPEFQADSSLVSGVVEVLERRLADLVDHIHLTDDVQYYIGEKDLCPEFASCSMLITTYRIRDQVGAIGILGPTRMDYSFNTIALDMVTDLIRDT